MVRNTEGERHYRRQCALATGTDADAQRSRETRLHREQ
jgi:hypothetical protein